MAAKTVYSIRLCNFSDYDYQDTFNPHRLLFQPKETGYNELHDLYERPAVVP